MSNMTRSQAGKLGAEKTNRLWKERYKENPKKCKHCQTSLLYEKRHNKFCNQSCSASFNNKKEGRRTKTIPQVQICDNCGIGIHDNYHKRKFCSQICYQEHQWEERKKEVEKGEVKSVRLLKKYLIETCDDVKCEICGIAEWRGQLIPLIMDHIDGDSENNDLQNLRLICGNCDMQLPTYKNRNFGNGRHYRRKRYAEGKSF